MTQVDGAFGGWDGWVLYTSEDGHKYHWNHLTHESRWAVGEAAEDHLAEVLILCYPYLAGSSISKLARTHDTTKKNCALFLYVRLLFNSSTKMSIRNLLESSLYCVAKRVTNTLLV